MNTQLQEIVKKAQQKHSPFSSFFFPNLIERGNMIPYSGTVASLAPIRSKNKPA
jgi:hypothetical protein